MTKGEQPDKGWREFVLNSLPTVEATTSVTPATGLTPGPVAETTTQPPFSLGPALSPQVDLLELLPPGAADKLRMLRQRSNDLHAVCVPHAEQQAATTERLQADQRLRKLQAHPQDHGFNLPETDSRVVEQQRLVDKLTDDLRRLQERSELRLQAWQSASQAKAACEDWLKHGKPSGVLLEDFEGPEPTLNKGEGVIDAVSRLRHRCRELRADQHRIASAPFPSAYAKQRAREQVEALAMQGAPSVSSLIELDGKIEFQTQRLTSEVHGERRSLAFTEVPDAVALTCWLHKSALIAALDREIASEADDKAALSHEARQKAEAEVMGDLLAVERDEAELTWKAQAERLPVEHRNDINPVALLGVQIVTAPRADVSPGSSPMHTAWDIRR